MKKNSLYIGLIALFMLAISSCSKDDNSPLLLKDAVAPELTGVTTDALVITEANASEVAFTMTWTDPQYGVDMADKYDVQMDVVGNDFASAISLGTTTSNSMEITNAVINGTAAKLKIPFATPTDVEFRVVASVQGEGDKTITGVAPINSNGMTANISTYEVIINYNKWYVPGDYQVASNYGKDNWAPENTRTVIRDINSDGKYEGYIYFASAASFKITSEPTWKGDNYTDDDGDGILKTDGSDTKMKEGGFYLMKVNSKNLGYSATKTAWGVIGDATPGGWNNDTNLTLDPVSHLWSVTLDLTAGAIKFRANGEWTLSYGDIDKNGKLDQEEGNNIAITDAGNYTITLNFTTYPYSYTLVKN
ncbi:SusE domain-containing protein [Halosquirtibacter laminarini]|uniref:SusE domain-containing protein n=1 Tax=Halosquirtibacter laminarini TaxID=3374600 RepID=A0AC61NEL5_9BACT|nr:SusE domain-containing protein [Prolixibacteraceae bacterium]